MNNVIESILTRRSVRKFTDKKIPEDEAGVVYSELRGGINHL